MRSAIFFAALLCLAAPAVQAQITCAEPAAPAPVDGGSANVDQLRAAMAQARDFIAQSDVFQACLLREVEAAKALSATDGKPFDTAIEAAAQARIAASQKAKENAGAAVNAALVTFKQANRN